MMRKKIASAFVALAALAVTPRAAADTEADVARARELFVEGAKLAESGNWEGARDRFERSAKLKRAALTLYNLGIAQQETSHLADAVESFRAFLALPVEPATQGFVAPVKGALAKLEPRVPRVSVAVKPADMKGLVVRIDGREMPREGPWMVNPGKHEITAVVPGRGEVQQTAVAAEGSETAITLAFTLSPSAGGLEARSVAVPMGLGISGLTLFLAGEIAFIYGARHGTGVLTKGDKAAMIAGNVVAGMGAALAGTGLVLLLRRPAARAPATAIAPWFAPGGGGAALSFTF